ncbi:hypothetical protein C7N43_20425 [Sphingobacteriales bacterium UPWRP_1]|nr:hypothetical protein BVG80_01995 [Sphingobacteriales bacterium TSM_CSM]PSJ75133.1 hypothetical protein C7N43_20425 [Sphingobacteriales bacterium UPWRP_1]
MTEFSIVNGFARLLWPIYRFSANFSAKNLPDLKVLIGGRAGVGVHFLKIWKRWGFEQLQSVLWQ